ncbi:MAG: flagellar biosynthetic protein FliO [Lachnospiraceae bacterium]|nr:flagellar biosynthetic protein FliO [Lachnospiraceae bacterium]
MLLSWTEQVDSVAQFMTVLLLFVFVLAITYVTTRYIAGYQKGRAQTGNLELLEALRLSGNKYLQIVRAGDKYLVVAVCKDTVTMLTELSGDELEAIREQEALPADFKRLFDKARSMQLPGKTKSTDEDK